MNENLQIKRLTHSCIDYIAETLLGESNATVQFVGMFADQQVIWNAKIIALNASPQVLANQYIDVSDNKKEGVIIPVEIGLFVDVIDEPTVFKVIMMLRQYKNLRSGKHEFFGINK